MTELEGAPIEVAVTAVEPDCPIETIATAWTRLAGLKRQAADLQRDLEQRIIAHIAANGGHDIRWAMDDSGGEMILTTKPDKSVKCRDVRRAVQVLCEVAAGDWAAVENCLSSAALKYGAVRKLLIEAGKPELYDELFETTVRTKLVPDEPPRLRSVDTRYIK